MRRPPASAPGARRPRTRRPSQGGGYLSKPVNAPVSSEFGWRFHPVLHYSRLHAGIDFAASCGTPVHAAADGDVIMAGWGGGYGNRIVVDHGLHRGDRPDHDVQPPDDHRAQQRARRAGAS